MIQEIKKTMRKYDFLNKVYIRLAYLRNHKKFLSLKNPVKFTEKIQWMKIYGNLEEISPYVDKYRVRSYVLNILDENHLIPLLGVYDSVKEINFEKLPNSFVLKATHSAGQNIIIKNKNDIDKKMVLQKIDQWLNSNYYELTGEINYKNIKPRVIIEEYIEDNAGELTDYKIYCFKGIPKFIQVICGRGSNETIDYFDMEWNSLDISSSIFTKSKSSIKKPENLNGMLEIAIKLSSVFNFVRVDLYNLDGEIYFGELTFTPANGLRPYSSDSHDRWIGDLIELDELKNLIISH